MNKSLSLAIMISITVLAVSWIYSVGLKNLPASQTPTNGETSASGEIILPVAWNGLGVKMIETGVIDAEGFEALYAGRGGLDGETRKLLYHPDQSELKITSKNAGQILNLLWALGLGNKNDILEKGPMMDPRYGGADRFASTGGWTLSKGGVMEHYSKHALVALTPDQQNLVERVSQSIYRPCCDNSTYFPDCNHGMAMLGLLELMAAEGASEKEMHQAALRVNSYWFPDEYRAIERYLELRGFKLDQVDPKEILGADYSSGSGYRRLLEELAPLPRGGGGSCGV